MLSSSRRLWLIAGTVGAILGLLSFLGDGRIDSRAFGILSNLASPWGLAAFFVGRLATSPRRGGLAGGITLLAGVATYYALGTLAGYVVGAGNLVWIVVALIAGPVMGFFGAVLATGQGWSVPAAVAAPSVMLLAEATFLLFERRAWRWDLAREPQRLSDLIVLAGLVLLAMVLPALVERQRIRCRVVYPAIVVAGLIGATGYALLEWLLIETTRIT